MIKPELFHKTISILVKAYFEGTLCHGECAACAVGNIIAANMGFKIVSLVGNPYHYRLAWDCDEEHYPVDWHTKIKGYGNGQKATEWIKSTGYNDRQLNNIEYAFEHSECKDKSGYSGLMAVCDTLMEIHQCSEEEIKEAKLRFEKT